MPLTSLPIDHTLKYKEKKTLLGGGESTPKNYGAISKDVSYM